MFLILLHQLLATTLCILVIGHNSHGLIVDEVARWSLLRLAEHPQNLRHFEDTAIFFQGLVRVYLADRQLSCCHKALEMSGSMRASRVCPRLRRHVLHLSILVFLGNRDSSLGRLRFDIGGVSRRRKVVFLVRMQIVHCCECSL